MSYILEALKKSQLEHARGRVPTLEVGPPPPADSARGRWVPLLSAMAVGALVAMAGARHFVGAPTVASGVAAPAVSDVPVEPPRPNVEKRSPALPAPEPKVASAPKSVPQAASTAKTALTAVPASKPPGIPRPAAPLPAEPLFASARPVELPTYAWHQLPESVRNATGRLELNIHVHSDEPAQRFVFINGRQYREGETLREGPSLEQILVSGVVLEYAGNRFRIDVPK